MHPRLLQRELDALGTQYTVRYEVDGSAVILDDVGLPVGWTPRTISIRYELPAGYPRSAPRVVLPWEIRRQGVVPRHLLSSGRFLVRGRLGDPIIYFPDWDPKMGNLRSLTETLLTDLIGPDRSPARRGSVVR